MSQAGSQDTVLQRSVPNWVSISQRCLACGAAEVGKREESWVKLGNRPALGSHGGYRSHVYNYRKQVGGSELCAYLIFLKLEEDHSSGWWHAIGKEVHKALPRPQISWLYCGFMFSTEESHLTLPVSICCLRFSLPGSGAEGETWWIFSQPNRGSVFQENKREEGQRRKKPGRKKGGGSVSWWEVVRPA